MLQLPAVAVFDVQEVVSRFVVGEPEALGIPHQFLLCADCCVAEQDHLRERTGVLEVRAGLIVVLNRVDPVLIVIFTGYPFDPRIRSLVVFRAGANEAGIATLFTGGEVPALPDEE